MSMTHTYHPSIREHGLQDGCDRCAEIAFDPFVGLDADNLRLLLIRTQKHQPSRSMNELEAMGIMEQTLRRSDQLDGILLQQQRDEDGNRNRGQ